MKPQVTFVPVDPPGARLTVRLADGPAVDDPTSGGGWVEVARPKRKALTEWVGYGPYRMTIPILFDGHATDRSVEPELEILRRMMRVPTPATGEPVVLRLEGPVPMTQLRWVIDDIETGQQLRAPSGHRTRVFQTVTLVEHIPADVVVYRQSPAKAAADRQSSASKTSKTYTVKSGDTLSAIAARQLGSPSKWKQIADLNGIRDPNRLQVGQTLRLP